MQYSDIPVVEHDVIQYLKGKKCPGREESQILSKHNFDKLLRDKEDDITMDALFKFWIEHNSQKKIYPGEVIGMIKDIFRIETFNIQKTEIKVLVSSPHVLEILQHFVKNIDSLKKFFKIETSIPVSTKRDIFYLVVDILNIALKRLLKQSLKGIITTDMGVLWITNDKYPDDLDLTLTI